MAVVVLDDFQDAGAVAAFEGFGLVVCFSDLGEIAGEAHGGLNGFGEGRGLKLLRHSAETRRTQSQSPAHAREGP